MNDDQPRSHPWKVEFFSEHDRTYSAMMFAGGWTMMSGLHEYRLWLWALGFAFVIAAAVSHYFDYSND